LVSSEQQNFRTIKKHAEPALVKRRASFRVILSFSLRLSTQKKKNVREKKSLFPCASQHRKRKTFEKRKN